MLTHGVWLPQADGAAKPASASVPPPRDLKPASIWNILLAHARANERTEGLPPILATDIDPAALHAAEANAGMAGVRDLIRFSLCDFADTPLPAMPGALFMNPEYGERLGAVDELEPLYARIGAFIRARCAGWRVFVLAGNRALSLKIGLKTSSLRTVFNGPIECRLLEFAAYERPEPAP